MQIYHDYFALTSIFAIISRYICNIVLMQALKKLYVVVSDDEVVMFETNAKSYVEKLNTMGVSDRNYDYFYREFKRTNKLTVTGTDGCQYTLQKLK